MFVKDLLGLCLVDPLVATIFFFRGSAAVRIRLPAADLLGIYVVSCVQRLRITSATFRRRNGRWPLNPMLTTPKGLEAMWPVRRPFFVWFCLSFVSRLVICGRKAAASS